MTQVNETQVEGRTRVAERLEIIEGLLGPLGMSGHNRRVVYAAYRISTGDDPDEVREELDTSLEAMNAQDGIDRYWPAPESTPR